MGTVLPRARRFLRCGRNCTGAAPGCLVSFHARAAAGPEAGSTPGPAPSLGVHSPQQPFLHPASLPVAPHVGGRRWCGFAVRSVAGWVSLIPCFSSRKPMVTAHRPCSAYSSGPGPRVLNEVFDSLSAFLLELIPQLVQNPGRDLWSR